MSLHFARQFKFILVTTLGVLGLSIMFNNCSNVDLERNEESSFASSTAKVNGRLPSPISPNTPYRVVFHVDHSHSMKFAGCATDVNGSSPRLNANGSAILNCESATANGTDPQAKRYKMLLNWISELNEMQIKYSKPIKVAILPFSGPMKDMSPGNQNPYLTYKFISLSEAKATVDALVELQRVEPAESLTNKKMFTTVPFPSDFFTNITTMIRGEMKELLNNGFINGSEFEIITISDGNLSPLDQHLNEVKSLANCSQASNENETDYCNNELPTSFIKAYGNPDDNKAAKISQKIAQLFEFQNEFPGSKIQYHYVNINYNPNIVLPTSNAFDQSITSLKEKNIEIPKWTVTDESKPVPFLLSTKFTPQKTYYIKNLYVISHNNYVDENGNQVIDSDADGLSDEEERMLGFDPSNPRSNVAGNNGRCLDSIFKLYGCESVRPCDSSTDLDADGLNQCEEMTISTDPRNPDSDFDSLPDLLEVRSLGLSPLFDESSLSSSGDGFTDHQHFLSNVHSKTPINLPISKQKIKFQLKNIGQVSAVNSYGQDVTMMSYSLDILNLPLVSTLEVNHNRSTYTYSIYDPDTRIALNSKDNIVNYAHAKNINHYTILIKMGALENPTETYWLSQHKKLEYKGLNASPETLKIDFSLFYQLQHMRIQK